VLGFVGRGTGIDGLVYGQERVGPKSGGQSLPIGCPFGTGFCRVRPCLVDDSRVDRSRNAGRRFLEVSSRNPLLALLVLFSSRLRGLRFRNESRLRFQYFSQNGRGLDASRLVRPFPLLAEFCFGQVFRSVRPPLAGDNSGNFNWRFGVVRLAFGNLERIASSSILLSAGPCLVSVLSWGFDYSLFGGDADSVARRSSTGSPLPVRSFSGCRTFLAKVSVKTFVRGSAFGLADLSLQDHPSHSFRVAMSFLMALTCSGTSFGSR